VLVDLLFGQRGALGDEHYILLSVRASAI